MRGGKRQQRHRRIIETQINRHRIVIPRSATKQVDVIAKILLKTHAGIQMMKIRQPGFGRHVISARHALLLEIRAVTPAGKRLIIICRQAQVFTPGFRPKSGSLQILIQQIVVKRVVAEQPFSRHPALANPGVTYQTVRLLCKAQLAPAQIAIIILPGDKPPAAAAVKFALFVDQ
ncbi:hypothetical protein D3C87_1627260 [compost metagenome]